MLREIDYHNQAARERLSVWENKKQYIASNADSLIDAKESVEKTSLNVYCHM